MRRARRFLALVLLVLPLLSACGDDKKAPEPGWSLPTSVREVKGGPIDEIVPPPSVIAWGGAASVEKLAKGVETFAKEVMPIVPRVQDVLQDELRARLALTKLEGIDWSKPARLAIFDPKGMPKGKFAFVLGVSDKEKLLAGIPATQTKKENDEGNAITYRDDLGRTICLSFIDDTVVITWEKKQLKDNVELFVRLAKSTIQSEQAFFLSAKNVAALYSKDIDEMIVEAKKQMGTSGAVPGLQAEAGSRVLAWMVSTFKELDRIEVVPAFIDDGARVSIKLHPKEGSELQKSFKSIEARPHDLIAKLPPDATMFASFSTNPDAVDGLTTRLVEWVMLVGFGGKAPEGYADSMKEYFKATNGQMAMAVHKPFTGEGLALTTLITVRDELMLRAAMRKSREQFRDKAAVENYKKSGITVTYKESAYTVAGAPADTTEVKLEKGKNPLGQLGVLGEAIGELSTNHNAVTKDLAVIGYGKEAKSTLEAFLNGKVTGGLDKAAGPTRAFKMAVESPVAILYISPVELLKRASLGGQNPLAESLKDIAGTSGVALSFSAKDGVFELVIDAPKEQARNIAQAASRARSIFPQ